MSQSDREASVRMVILAARHIIDVATMRKSLFPSDGEYLAVSAVEKLHKALGFYLNRDETPDIYLMIDSLIFIKTH
jgi:hypothetical protein